MKNFWQDIRYAARMLKTKPGFTFASVISLALGIGACTAIFSIVDAVLLKPLPYPEPNQLVALREVGEGDRQMSFTEANFLDVRHQNQSFESLAEYVALQVSVTGAQEPVRTQVCTASNEFFKVLGIQPVLGRTFLPEESRPESATSAVVSYGFWQRLLGGRQDLSGVTLRIYNRSFNVVGVMPQDFSFPKDTEVWTNREAFPVNPSRTSHGLRVVGRLRADATIEQARVDLTTIGKQLKQQYGKLIDAQDFSVTPLHQLMVGNVRQSLYIFLAAVGFLLLVACANVANMLLAQVTTRQREFALRSALGATRFRLAKQFITENVLLALVAGSLGVILSIWGVDFLLSLNQQNLPYVNEIAVNWRALIFTFGLAILVALLLGLVPLFHFSGNNLQENLKEAGRGQSAHTSSARLRGALVTAQIALTLVLLIGAGLSIKSFIKLMLINPGFQAENAVAMDVSVPSVSGADEASRLQQLTNFHGQLLERLQNLPGVIAVGGVDGLPMTQRGANGQFLIDNDPTKQGYGEYRIATEGFFAAMGIPLLRGRLFESSDTMNSTHVAVINESLARKYWPAEDPLGRQIQYGNMDGDTRLFTIVGIVNNVRENGLDADTPPTFYAYYVQRPRRLGDFTLVVRAQSDPTTLVSAMRSEVRSLNSDVPVNFRTLEQVFSSSLDNRRFSLVIFAAFAIVALLLAITGIYGVMSYVVAQRTQEIGVRMALGASVSHILKLVIGQGMRWVFSGIGLGLIGAFGLSRLIESFLFNVSPNDLTTFVGVACLLVFVALLACFIPARRATRTDPMVALRCD
jgi:putative ABC transport system permease protein